MPETTCCCAARTGYCDRCDVLVGLNGLHVIDTIEDAGGRLVVMVESEPAPPGCPTCGVVAAWRGRRTRWLIDLPCFGRPIRIRWRARTWRCLEPACPTGAFTEPCPIAEPPAKLTVRACWWAVGQIRFEHASVAGIARQLGCGWWTVWRNIKPLLEQMAADDSRFDGVTTLGVDEHIWHHADPRKRGPKAMTGMVDLTRDPQTGKTKARLLDLVPGRTGNAYRDWLADRGDDFKARVQVATLDPFHGYKNAIDDQLADAVAVLDAFHVVKLGGQAVDEVRRRVQQQIHGHRGRKHDPLYKIRNLLRSGADRLTDRQWTRLETAIAADDRHDEVLVAWQCAQQLRAVYHQTTPAAGRRLAIKIINSFPSCPIPEIARLGRTLKRWRQAFLGYFDTQGASNGGTEAINGLIELHRRIARGFWNPANYRLRMLLIAGGLTPPER